jgi:hypothetical protein
LTAFRADNAAQIKSVPLPEPPTALATTGRLLCVGLASGSIIGFDEESGSGLWQNAAFRGDVQMRSGGELIWASERDGGALLAFNRSGPVARVSTQGLRAFAAADSRIFWLSKDDVLVASDLSGKATRTEPLPQALEVGAMACCANALWFSAANGLLMIDLVSLQRRSHLAAPEGPVTHLICKDGKLAGGSRKVFVLNPMTDIGIHTISVEPQSPLRGIAATATKIWALESAEPLVHIADFF